MPVRFCFFVFFLLLCYLRSGLLFRSVSSLSIEAGGGDQPNWFGSLYSTTACFDSCFCIIPAIITPPVYGSVAVAAPGLVSGTVGTVLLLLLLFFVLFAVCYDGKKQLEIRKQTAADDDELWGDDEDEVVTSRYSDFFFKCQCNSKSHTGKAIQKLNPQSNLYVNYLYQKATRNC